MSKERKPRVLLVRDDELHTRGYWVVAQGLRDGGIEVILGGVQTPREIVAAAMQEDVDIIGYHIMTGAAEILLPMLFDKMKESGVDVDVIVGGIVPLKYETKFKELGVREIFKPNSTLDSINEFIHKLAAQRQTSRK